MSETMGKSLEERVREWIGNEGYPLEFGVAKKFNDAGFSVSQGRYVRDRNSDVLREIDICAYVSSIHPPPRRHLLRSYYVVECKWSKDKPWVVFTNEQSMATSACIAQSISSSLGSAILWKEAGLEELQSLAMFSTPKRAGFNGRQAFSRAGSDHFYNSMKSIVSSAKYMMDEYDQPRKREVLPDVAVVAFPLIVVDGQLFEAYLDNEKDGFELEIEQRTHIRCHWRGSREWPLHATVDVVTFDHLGAFLTGHAQQMHQLLDIMERSLDEIIKCVEAGSIQTANITRAPRGVTGIHWLFREISKRQQSTQSEPRQDSDPPAERNHGAGDGDGSE